MEWGYPKYYSNLHFVLIALLLIALFYVKETSKLNLSTPPSCSRHFSFTLYDNNKCVCLLRKTMVRKWSF